MKEINKIQKAILTLIKETSFNRFDGKKIYKDLINNSHLWEGVVYGRFGLHDLIILRDLPQGVYNADEMYVSVPNKKLNKFKRLIKGWEYSDINTISLSPYESRISDPSTRMALFNRWGDTDTGDLTIVRLWWH